MTDRNELVRDMEKVALIMEHDGIFQTGQSILRQAAARIEADGKLMAEMRRLLLWWMEKQDGDDDTELRDQTHAILARLDAEAQR